MYVTYYSVQKRLVLDTETLNAALDGYGLMLKEITRRITSLEREINEYKTNHRLAYKMSPQAKKRISEAQKKRWKQYRADRREIRKNV